MAWGRRGVGASFKRIVLHRARPAQRLSALFVAMMLLRFGCDRAQEVFSNIVKHAAASRVSVAMRLQDQAVLLALEDDGVGF